MQQEGNLLKAKQRGYPDPHHTSTLASGFSAPRIVRNKWRCSSHLISALLLKQSELRQMPCQEIPRVFLSSLNRVLSQSSKFPSVCPMPPLCAKPCVFNETMYDPYTFLPPQSLLSYSSHYTTTSQEVAIHLPTAGGPTRTWGAVWLECRHSRRLRRK